MLRSRRLLLRGPSAPPSCPGPGRLPSPSLTTRSKRLRFDRRVVLRPRVESWRGASVEKEPPGPGGDSESEEPAPGGRVRRSPGRAGGTQKKRGRTVVERLELLRRDERLLLKIVAVHSRSEISIFPFASSPSWPAPRIRPQPNPNLARGRVSESSVRPKLGWVSARIGVPVAMLPEQGALVRGGQYPGLRAVSPRAVSPRQFPHAVSRW